MEGLNNDELRDDFKEITRDAVLEALDSTVKSGRGWKDSDLTELFKIVDSIAERNFNEREHLLNPS